jgi:phosphatidylglycerol---prolipoprotein diacylglyceryl transferase
MIAAISYPPVPILELGPLALSLHGLFAGIGFIVGAGLLLKAVERRGFDSDKVSSVLTWALVGAILGARLFTVPAHLGDPGYGLSDVIGLGGAFSILGGYAGGILVAWFRMRQIGLDSPALLDMAAPGLAIGAVVGRIGDLAIVEHLGSSTTFFLGYAVKPGYDLSPQHNALECTPSGAVDGVCGIYHPTWLYDMIGAAILLGVLLWLIRTKASKFRYGQMFAIWLIWYGFQRFLIDFTRLSAAKLGTVADSVIGPFTGSQWGGLGASLIGIGLFVAFQRGALVSAEGDASRGAVLQSAEEAADDTA